MQMTQPMSREISMKLINHRLLGGKGVFNSDWFLEIFVMIRPRQGFSKYLIHGEITGFELAGLCQVNVFYRIVPLLLVLIPCSGLAPKDLVDNLAFINYKSSEIPFLRLESLIFVDARLVKH